jgi:hypothetical protein
MTKEMYFNKVILKQKIEFYREQLLLDFAMASDYSRLASAIFFPTIGIDSWISNLAIDNFYSSLYRGPKVKERMCTLTEIDLLRFPTDEIASIPSIDYLISSLKFNTIEEFSKNSYPYYYIIPNDFVKKLDSIFFETLTNYFGYTGMKASKKIVTKKIVEGVHFHFSVKRQDFNFSTISDYWFPDFSIEINSKKYYISNGTDLSTFLFLPTSSFLFFYNNSHTFITDSTGKIIGSESNENEPVTIYDKSNNSYIFTNPEVSKKGYTKYITVIIILFCHYLNVFENWFREHVLPEIAQLDNG